MAETLLIVPAVENTDGPLSYTEPKYADRAEKVGAKTVEYGNRTVCVALFVGEKSVTDGIEREGGVRKIPDSKGIDKAIRKVTDSAAWTGPPVEGRDELIDFLRP